MGSLLGRCWAYGTPSDQEEVNVELFPIVSVEEHLREYYGTPRKVITGGNHSRPCIVILAPSQEDGSDGF